MMGQAILVGLLLILAIPLGVAAAPRAPSPRQVTALATGWRFHFGDDAAGATAAAFDDTAWRSVNLPHTWNRLGEYRLTRSAATDDRQGVGVYRLRFAAPAPRPGRRAYLQFDGVGNIAQVWLNGVKIGEHRGAFSAFRFDVTPYLRADGANVLVVKADNTRPAPGASTQDVIPLGGDFFIFGGLYRGVHLIEASDVGIDLLDHGGPGVYARTLSLSPDQARVAVLTRLRDVSGRPHRLTARTELTDADGAVVARASDPAVGPELTQTLTLAAPHPWDGRAAPYLYHVTVRLFDDGRLVDAVTQPVGLRAFHIDADQGLFLNGRHLRLIGAARHQDREGEGWAVTPADHAQDMAILAEMGANTVRMAHYQHAPEWFDLADRTGMVAWAEIPFVNAATFTDGAPANAALTANAREQLTELIRQNYNHPSVLMWSVGNETDIGAAFGRGRRPARSIELLRQLSALAHAEDLSRPTTFADCCEEPDDAIGNHTNPVLAGSADLIGYNRYYGWYYGRPADLGAKLDHFHAIHPQVPMSLSEYGAGGALSQHSDNPLGGPVNAFGRPHPEEYQSYLHEQTFKVIDSRPYLFASWLWNLFDFASDLRAEGDSIDLNDKGLVTYDRKIRKDAFYFYKANLNPTPMIHLNSARYVDRAYPETDVRAYASAPQARLSVNGQDRGVAECPGHVCVWPHVALRPGDNTVTATAGDGAAAVSDTLHWNGPDVAREGLHLDAGDLAGHVGPDGVRYGSDTFFQGGEGKVLNLAGFGAGRDKGRKTVAGAADASLFEYYREGAFSYDLPVPAGRWEVAVRSFEPDAGQCPTRRFAVRIDGQTMAQRVAPCHDAGGPLEAVTTRYLVEANRGRLRLDFLPDGGPAVVAAIDISKAP